MVFSYLTNRLIVILTLAVLIGLFIYSLVAGYSFSEALGSAAAVALAFFLSWAISREIDPAHDWSAFTAPPFTLGAALICGPPALAALFFILLLSRFINLSPGLKATVFDSALLIIFGAFLFTGGFPAALPILAAAFGFDAILEPAGRRQAFFAFLALALFAVMLIFFYPGPDPGAGFNLYNGSVSLLIAACTVILGTKGRKKAFFADREAKKLDHRRINLAVILVALFSISTLYLKGNAGPALLYPVGFAYLGTAAYNLVRRTDKNG